MANENLDAAGERLQKALNQLQTTVDGLLDKAERELSGSVEQMNALRDERERFEVALVCRNRGNIVAVKGSFQQGSQSTRWVKCQKFRSI